MSVPSDHLLRRLGGWREGHGLKPPEVARRGDARRFLRAGEDRPRHPAAKSIPV